MNAGGFRHSFAVMPKPTKQSQGATLPKPQKRRDNPPATSNKRVAEQIREILGKHYASKYRVR